jgi:chromosome segregation ATPase
MTEKISSEDFQRIYKVVEEKGGIVIALVFVAILFGILFLSLWVGQISKNTGVNTTDLESRLIQLEEGFELADEVSTEFLTDTGAQLQFLDKEIKKLWDLSNKRNKANIQKIFTELEVIKKQNMAVTRNLNQLKASSSNASKELKNLSDIIKRLNIESEEFKAIAQQIDALQRRMLVLDETIQAFDNFRKQTNQSIVDIQTLINESNNSAQQLTSP